MEPVGLTFKNEGWDKLGQPKQGEIMVVHRCRDCQTITINRLAGDDLPEVVFRLFNESLDIAPELKLEIKQAGIKLLSQQDKPEVHLQLFGNN
jgi:hypothetical protein